MESRQVGTTRVRVTTAGLGCAPVGKAYADGEDDAAAAVVRRAYEMGIRYFDTAPIYGLGRSEARVGRALAGVPRDEVVVSTKVGRLLVEDESGSGLREEFDFSRDGVLRSIEESIERLGLDRVDIALLHGPKEHHYEQAIGEAYPALADLRSQGVVQAIGAGMTQWEMPARFAAEGDFDCFLVAGRYTLLDQSALAELLPLCVEGRVSVVLAGPYNSGILASDLSPGASYHYEAAPPEILDRARRLRAVCDGHGVPLKAAAIQFGLAHPAAVSALPGPHTPAEVEENVLMASYPIPGALWNDLKDRGMLPESAPTPAGA